jgi:hypothetical protein
MSLEIQLNFVQARHDAVPSCNQVITVIEEETTLMWEAT